MKRIFAILGIGSLLLTGCTTRLVDFTLISSKNIELDRFASYQRAQSRVEGEDMVHWIILVPTGVPSAKEAMDRAIESVPGAVALVDGVITSKFWFVPYIYGQQRFVVEGTPLIDPKLASVWKHGNYLVTNLDPNGNVRETRTVTKVEYESLKERMIPASGS